MAGSKVVVRIGGQRRAQGGGEAHTSYPILRNHKSISGMACLFMPWPDFRMASTMEKFDWRVFRAAMASCLGGEHCELKTVDEMGRPRSCDSS